MPTVRHPDFIDDFGVKMAPEKALELGLNPETGYPLNFDDIEAEIRTLYARPLPPEAHADGARKLFALMREAAKKRQEAGAGHKPTPLKS